MSETYFRLRADDPALAEGGAGSTIRSMMSEEDGGVTVLLGMQVQHLSLLLVDWARLLLPEELWASLQPQLERDFSAIRDDPGGVWLHVQGRRLRSVEVRSEVCHNIRMVFDLRSNLMKRMYPSLPVEWRRGLLIAEVVWPALQPLLEKDLSAIRHAEVWLQAEGKRHPVDPRPYRLVEVRDACDMIDLSLSRFDIFDAWDVLRLRTGLAERLTGYPADGLLLKEGIDRKRTAMRVETADELRMLFHEAVNDLNMVRPNPLRFRDRPPRIFLWSDEINVDSQVVAEIRRSALDGVVLENAIIGT